MRLIQYDDDYVFFLNRLYIKNIDFDNNKDVTNYINGVLKKISDCYHIQLKGFYKIYVYINEIYGIILEVMKMDDYGDYDVDSVDLKIIIKNKSKFFLETSNYDIVKNMKEFYLSNNKYYFDIKYIINDFNKYIEHFDIIYKDIDKKVMKANKIRRD